MIHRKRLSLKLVSLKHLSPKLVSSPAIAGLLLSALLLSSFTQTSYSRRPAATAATPPEVKQIKLPGEINLKPGDVVPMNPNRRRIVPVPFTVAEIQPLVAKHVKVVNGVAHITVKNQLVPLARYVAELNLWENYLTSLGYTLRDRALALPRKPGEPGPIAIPGMRDNFGPILKMREPTKLDVPIPNEKPDVDVDKRTKWPFIDLHTIENPYAAVINPNIRIDRGGVITSIPRTRGNTPTRAQYRVPRTNNLALKNMRTRHLNLPGLDGGRRLRTMDTEMPCSSKTVVGCPCMPEGPFCKDGLARDTEGGLLDCSASVALNPVGGSSGGVGPPATTTVTTPGTSCGDKTAGDPPCLYAPNSSMNADWEAIANCITSSTSTTWFTVGLCSEMTFRGNQKGGNLFLNNAGQQHFSLKLFGTWFDLLDASSYSEYSQGQLSSDTKVSVPLLGDLGALEPEGFSGNYDMPPVTIPLAGIVNLKITGGGAFSMGFKKNDAPFTPPPSNCEPGAKNGMLGLNLESQAYADLHLTAALDALVLSAGIKGVLVIADDKMGLKMRDFIKPSSNEVVVNPEFTYQIKHMEGHVYVVLTVDVLIYSKTFELEIFNFGGFKPEPQTVVIPPRTYATKAGVGDISRVRRLRSGELMR